MQMALKLVVTGTVQGVGFRPFVYGLAHQLSLRGFVRNCGGEVEIGVDGSSADIDEFLRRLRENAPPLAIVDSIKVSKEHINGSYAGFVILHSRQAESGFQAVPPDTATCTSCLADILDAAGRRFNYPFTNCTACGPRFTIIQALPYDRRSTTMSHFQMCVACRAEFEDPSNRRFHAQPNACWECGPQIWLTTSGAGARAIERHSPEEQLQHLNSAVDLILAGRTIALKGLGGFHLVCDATNDDAVQSLRNRKRRYDKPFAVMFANIEHARQFAHIDHQSAELLTGPRCPVVLLPQSGDLAEAVAPGMRVLGVMLPYTPLHHLIMARAARPLVMTSGNLSDEPICMENSEALQRLEHLADAFLLHDRVIETRFDDSVIRCDRGSPIMVRRSRGYAPEPITFPAKTEECILAVGAQLKATFCLAKGGRAFVSQHLGDLDDVDSHAFFMSTLDRFINLFDLGPAAVVHDLHPDYLSTRIANELAVSRGIPAYAVQHHHAHIASCMAENMISERVIGVALDGTGYGDDGTIWGGEFLIADYSGYERFAHFAPVAMPGMEAAIRQPIRMLAAYVHELPESQIQSFLKQRLKELFSIKQLSVLEQQLEKRINCATTTSCGRLFDAVSALLGVCLRPSFEGQAAMQLECLAARGQYVNVDVELRAERTVDGLRLISILAGMLIRGEEPANVAFMFHELLSQDIARLCVDAASRYQINIVCLTGGCFQNGLLLSLVTEKLRRHDLRVATHARVPPNDGGISLGQAAVGAWLTGKWRTE